MAKNLRLIAIWFIIVGTIGVGLNAIFGQGTFIFLHRIRTPSGLWLYEIDIWGYVNNVKNSFSDVARLSLATPDRSWVNITSSFVQPEFWEALVNNMALMLDWFIFTINVIIYPIRIGGYILLQYLALLGINVLDPEYAGGLKWLVELCTYLKSLQIPYV